MERLFFPREIADNNHPAVVGCVIVLCVHDLIFNVFLFIAAFCIVFEVQVVRGELDSRKYNFSGM